MLYKNLANQDLYILALNKTTGEPVTGIAGTVTGKVSKDGAAFSTLSNAPSELEGGIYTIALTQAETNGDALAFIFSSTNTSVNIAPQIFYTSDTAPAVTLASTGLDSVSLALPTGPASNFREQINLLYQRFFGKTAINASTGLKVYDTDNTTVITTQTVSDDGTTQTINAAS